MKIAFEKAIATARENGMKVMFNLEISGPGLPSLSEEASDKLFEEYKEFIVRWLDFAEKYKLYAFNLNSELDNEFFVPLDCTGECREARTNKFLHELLPIAREHFSGKIGVGLMEVWATDGQLNVDYDLDGYDFFTTNLPCGDGKILQCLEFAGVVIDGANILKEKHGVQRFVISEWDIFSEKDATPEGKQAVQGYAIVSEEEEAEFYAKFFEQYGSKIDGIAITYSDPLGVKTNEKAKGIIKDFLEKNKLNSALTTLQSNLAQS